MLSVSMESRSVRAWSALRTGVLPRFYDVLRPADGACGVRRNYLADDQPIEEHSDCGEVLLHGRYGAGVLFNVGGDHDRLDLLKVANATCLAPVKELGDGRGVRGVGIPVADVGCKELDEAARSPVAGTGDYRGQDFEGDAVEVPRRNWDDLVVSEKCFSDTTDDFLAHGRCLK